MDAEHDNGFRRDGGAREGRIASAPPGVPVALSSDARPHLRAAFDVRPRTVKASRVAAPPRLQIGVAVPARRQRDLRGHHPGDTFFHGLTILFALLVIAVAAVMVVTLVVQSWPALTRFGLSFLVSQQWSVGTDHFGALVFIFGTLYTSFLALLLAVPLSLGVAIFLSELAPARLRGPVSTLVELLAAVPSVVYGLWGIFVLAALVRSPLETWLGAHFGGIPLFGGPAYGSGILAAALILTVMIVPTIAAISRDVLRAVPREQREGLLALGATRWETIARVVVPYARAGIVGAIILGLGRAVGETMAVTMVIGNGRYVGPSLFAITDTLASVIANQFAEATGTLYTATLLELGLILFVLAVVLNALARLLVRTVAREPGRSR
jgi:phosphate transport system permease protein